MHLHSLLHLHAFTKNYLRRLKIYQFGLLKFDVRSWTFKTHDVVNLLLLPRTHNGFHVAIRRLNLIIYLAICTSASTFVLITFSFPVLKFIYVRLSRNPQSTIASFASSCSSFTFIFDKGL